MEIIKQTENEILIGIPRSYVASGMALLITGFLPGMFMSVNITQVFPIILGDMGIYKLTCDRPEPQQLNCQVSKSKYLGLISDPDSNYKFFIPRLVTNQTEGSNPKLLNSNSSYKPGYVSVQKNEGIISGLNINHKPVSYFTYYLNLRTNAKNHELLQTENALLAGELEMALNQFLNSQQDSFSFIRDNRFNIFVNSDLIEYSLSSTSIILLIFFGLFWMIFHSSNLIIDKSRNTFAYRHNFFFLKWNSHQISIDKILEIEIKESNHVNDDDEPYKLFDVVIMVQSKSSLQPQKYKFDYSTKDYSNAVETANLLRKFLGFPLEIEPSV